MNLASEISLEKLQMACNRDLDEITKYYIEKVPSLALKEAMEYTTLFCKGKRLRPLLVYAAGTIFNAPLECLILPAAALEMVHIYSLIHDDLPCMDAAELRRGLPTCHKKFGEAMAVLVGDALQSLAIQILATHQSSLPSTKRLQMIADLSIACGPSGMIAGQIWDLHLSTMGEVSGDFLEEISQYKTGALIATCLKLAWLASRDEDEINQQTLEQFGKMIGLAFQIQDDILDIEKTTHELGKTQGMDFKNNKLTYPLSVGIENAKTKVAFLYQEALLTINYLGEKARLLRELTTYMLQRQR